MKIESELKRDMHNQFLVLKKDKNNDNSYGLMMLQNNNIKGLLPLEVRMINNQHMYYYDITSKQPLSNMFGKGQLKYNQIRDVMIGIIDAINISREFLLDENDIILEPDYIYLDLPNNDVNLCHVIGYNKNIQKQMSTVIEYLMNKVDYIDESAVLLTYSLYKLSTEETCTFNKLYGLLEKSGKRKNNAVDIKELGEETQRENESIAQIQNKRENESRNKRENESRNKRERESRNKRESESQYKRGQESYNKSVDDSRERYEDNYLKDQVSIKKQKKENKKNNSALTNKVIQKKHLENIPIMDEKLQSEEEITVISKMAILVILLSVIVILVMIIIVWNAGVLYNREHQLDVTKVFGLFIIVGSSEAYLLSKILAMEKRETKIINKIEYINPSLIDLDKDSQNHRMLIIENEDNYSTIQNKEDASIVSNTNNTIFGDFESGIDRKDILDENNSNSYIKTELLRACWNEETTLLADFTDTEEYKLITLQPSEYSDIKLMEFPFFIGKLKTNVDYVIEKNTISRFHAKIEKERDQFFITDLNTTNGTYLNDIKLQANVKKKLKLNDIITFADIKYRFQKVNN